MDTPVFAAIVQARMGSTRLEGKALADLSGRSVLFHVLKRASMVKGVSKTVLATSTDNKNKPLILLAEGMGLGVFAGPERNVLKRYCMASEKYPSDYIVRITGDNPFTDIYFAEKAVEMASETGADLCSFSDLPLGTAVEIIKTKALFKTLDMAKKPYQLEHVTPYIKENPGRFKIVRREAGFKSPFKNLRLTVDTAEDLELARAVYVALYRGEPFGLQEIMDYISGHPELIAINSHIEQLAMTSYEKTSKAPSKQKGKK